MSISDIRGTIAGGRDQPIAADPAAAIRGRPRIAVVLFLCGLAALALLAWQSTVLLPAAIVLPLAVLLTAGYCGMGSLISNGLARFTELNRRELNGLLSRQLRHSKRLAILDPVTALLQPWYFELRVAEETSRCLRYGSSMAIALIRVPVSASSAPLTEDASGDLPPIFSNMLRSIDLATKLADDEYAFCLPETNETGARRALHRLLGKAHVAALEVGLVVCPRDGESWESLLTQATQTAQPLTGSEPAPLPTDRRQKYLAIAEQVSREPAGEIALGPEETVKGLKLSLRHASRRAGVTLKIWEVDGTVYFERMVSPNPNQDTAVA